MISRDELTRIAKRRMLTLGVMEKDYALTWTLKAIYSNPKLSKYLVFKGGTCLSKVYAENYRLSEDLDFSIDGRNALKSDELRQEMGKALASANQIGAPSLSIIEKDAHENPGMIILQIRYVGPLGQPNRLKVEVTLNERVIYAPERRDIKEKTYSDIEQFTVTCYAITEILAEKLRAIMQRGKTRDYYDVWQMLTKEDIRSQVPHELPQIHKRLEQKCKLAGVQFSPEVMFDKVRLEEARAEWANSLGRLVKDLPDFSMVIENLKKPFWKEVELAEFNDDLHYEHVRNLARKDDDGGLFLIRCVELVVAKMNSNKAVEVVKALDTLISMCGNFPELAGEIKVRAAEILLRLRNDRDMEIKERANDSIKRLGLDDAEGFIERRLNRKEFEGL